MTKFTIDKKLYKDYLKALKNPFNIAILKDAKENLLTEVARCYFQKYTTKYQGNDIPQLILDLINEGGTEYIKFLNKLTPNSSEADISNLIDEIERFDRKNKNLFIKYGNFINFLALNNFTFPTKAEVDATTGNEIEITTNTTIDVIFKRIENVVKKPFKATLEAQKASKPFSGITKRENLFAFGKRLFTTAGMGFLGFKAASKLIKFMPVNNVVKAAVTALFAVLGNVLAGLYISSEKFTVDSQATGVKKFLGKVLGSHANLFAKKVNSTSAYANASFSTKSHVEYYQKIALDEYAVSQKKVSFMERVMPNELRENNNITVTIR
ncbi:MAG: hypothetical protein BGO27_00890 [Alphaproteobacteria bacterium 33-17]|nr:MAG: hypothetical protein BGO27_00890 [Alphaproteobacteria bacterium 33-17]